MTTPDPNVPPARHEAPASQPLYLAWAAFQRRPVSMAPLAGFDCVFLPMAYKGRSHLRRAGHYLALAWRTWRVLRQRRPHTVWLQLPQLPLLWVLLLYRWRVDPRVRLVADCHNAVFAPPWSRLPLTAAALARADLVLVHNDAVLQNALAMGLPVDRTRVLEDVPAARPPGQARPPVPAAFAGRPRPWVLFAGSYGRDEPVAEVLHAARLLDDGVLVVTGRRSNAARNGHDIQHPPDNVVLTDYLPLPEFDALMVHADVVLALTRQDGIQLSVCNEALGFGRPLVVADTPLLRRLFGSAAERVDVQQPADLVRGIRAALARQDELIQAGRALAARRCRQWQDEQWRDCQAVLAADGR